MAPKEIGDYVYGLRIQLTPNTTFWERLAREEVGYGFEWRYVPVESAAGQLLGWTSAFIWPWDEATLGPQIESGRYTDITTYGDIKNLNISAELQMPEEHGAED